MTLDKDQRALLRSLLQAEKARVRGNLTAALVGSIAGPYREQILFHAALIESTLEALKED